MALYTETVSIITHDTLHVSDIIMYHSKIDVISYFITP